MELTLSKSTNMFFSTSLRFVQSFNTENLYLVYLTNHVPYHLQKFLSTSSTSLLFHSYHPNQVSCTGLSLSIINVVAGPLSWFLLWLQNTLQQLPSGNSEKIQVYYLQDLKTTQYTCCHTVRSRSWVERERESMHALGASLLRLRAGT